MVQANNHLYYTLSHLYLLYVVLTMGPMLINWNAPSYLHLETGSTVNLTLAPKASI